MYTCMVLEPCLRSGCYDYSIYTAGASIPVVEKGRTYRRSGALGPRNRFGWPLPREINTRMDPMYVCMHDHDRIDSESVE